MRACARARPGKTTPVAQSQQLVHGEYFVFYRHVENVTQTFHMQLLHKHIC